MTATGHALVAALIAAKFHNPYVAIPASFVSHFALDLIPHWDTGLHHRDKTKQALVIESGIDVGISFLSAYVLYHGVLGGTDSILLFASVIAAQLPDWITAPYLILRTNNVFSQWSKWMYKVQHLINSRLDQPWGIVTQVATVFILYVILFRFI
ncbi:MAG: hypothetical protein ACM3IJ_04600 [Candidatus Levyibacteriota bacterium]